MKRKTADTLAFYIMAAAGGIFGGFTVIYAGILGAAQSTNLITFIIALFGRDVKEMLVRVGLLAVFALGTASTRIIKECCKLDIRTASIIVDIICTAVILLIPERVDPMLVIYPAVFAMAFQYNSFTGALGFASSSVFSSNNFRQFIDSAAEYFCTRKFQAKKKCVFFAGSLFSFHVGVIIAVAGTLLFGKISIAAAFIPVFAAIAPVLVSYRKNVEE